MGVSRTPGVLAKAVCKTAMIEGCIITQVTASGLRSGAMLEFKRIVRPLSSTVCSSIKDILEQHYKISKVGSSSSASKSCFITSTYGEKPQPAARSLDRRRLLSKVTRERAPQRTERATHRTGRAPQQKTGTPRGGASLSHEQQHTIRWKRGKLAKSSTQHVAAPLSMDMYRPDGFPFDALNTFSLSPASYARLGVLLFERGTADLLAPAASGNDFRGTLVLHNRVLKRQHGAATQFMFTGNEWSSPSKPSAQGSRRTLRSIDTDTADAAGLIVGDGKSTDLRPHSNAGSRRLLNVHTDTQERNFESFWASVWDSISTSDDYDRDEPCSIMTYAPQVCAASDALLAAAVAHRRHAWELFFCFRLSGINAALHDTVPCILCLQNKHNHAHAC